MKFNRLWTSQKESLKVGEERWEKKWAENPRRFWLISTARDQAFIWDTVKQSPQAADSGVTGRNSLIVEIIMLLIIKIFGKSYWKNTVFNLGLKTKLQN